MATADIDGSVRVWFGNGTERRAQSKEKTLGRELHGIDVFLNATP